MELKDRIKSLRKDKGLSQEEFAKRLGVARNTIANYETGARAPMDAMIVSICREFNVNEEWLRTGEGEPHIDNKAHALAELSKTFEVSELEKDIVTSLLDLPVSAQKSIADYIKFMAAEYKKNNPAENSEKE